MRPSPGAHEALDRIDALVRKAAPLGGCSLDLPADLLPDDHMEQWSRGILSDSANRLKYQLKQLGYRTNPVHTAAFWYVRLYW